MNRQQMAQGVSFMTKRITTKAAIVCTVLGLGSITASAGNLYPPGPPAPTMRTVEQLKPSWDRIISPADQRFVGALQYHPGTVGPGNVIGMPYPEAYLDKETGLVWPKTPYTTPLDWYSATSYCLNLVLGGRSGWRLPTLPELSSLLEYDSLGYSSFPAIFNTAANT